MLANKSLELEIEDLLFRPPGRPSRKPLVRYKSFRYQAKSWTTPRRIVAKVEHHQGELFPRVGFIVTNMARPSRSVVRFYNTRGTAEQWIKEGNSWELLLKARLLKLANNRLAVILSYEHRQRADGTHSEKLYRKKSRSGTYLSVGLFRAIDRLRDDFGDTTHPSVRQNLELLCEVRDNAVHFINKGFDISKLVQELGTACLRNYLGLVDRWFAIVKSRSCPAGRESRADRAHQVNVRHASSRIQGVLICQRRAQRTICARTCRCGEPR